MRTPSFYKGIERVLFNDSLTPVLIVLGGSSTTGLSRPTSDIDVYSFHLEDVPARARYENEEVTDIIDKTIEPRIMLYSSSLTRARNVIFESDPLENPVGEFFRQFLKLYFVESFLARPRIYHAPPTKLEEEIKQIPHKDLVRDYLSMSKLRLRRYLAEMSYHPTDYGESLRLVLTGKHLLETGKVYINIDDLMMREELRLPRFNHENAETEWIKITRVMQNILAACL